MESATIGSIVSISKGKKHSSLFDSPNGKAKRYIQIEDLRNDFNLKYTDEVGVDVNANDVIIAWDGANAGTIGFDLNGYIGSTLARLRIRDNIVHSKYLGWLLRGKFNYLRSQCTGATIPHISKSVLENISVPLPDLQTQQKIASILAQADAARQKRKQASQLTEQFLQSAFLEMFGDPVWNEKRWEVRTIEGLIKNERHALKRGPFGGALKKEIFVPTGYLVYEQFHALNNDFTFARYFIDEEKFQELKAFEVKEGDIIISCSGVYLGKLAIVPKGAIKGIINQALLKITLDEKKITNHFFVYLFSHPSFKNRFYGNISGTGIPNFPSMDEFKKFQFIYPPLPLQQKFAALVEQVECLRTKQRESERELDNLFQSLMQKYFG